MSMKIGVDIPNMRMYTVSLYVYTGNNMVYFIKLTINLGIMHMMNIGNISVIGGPYRIKPIADQKKT